MRYLFCFLASLPFVCALAGPPSVPLTCTQVSVGYSNVAAVQLIKASQQRSMALARAGFIPADPFTNATVGLEGQSIHPSGRIRGTGCESWFFRGALNDIRRSDLFEDKGPASLILRHLTNSVLTLKVDAAADRALKVLSALSYDADAIRKAYRITVKDDLMDAYPVRDGGPNFPKELHFFGELISRAKIRIVVEFTPKNAAALANCWDPINMQIEFLATTGELLKAQLAGPDALTILGVRGPTRLGPIEAPDFTPPRFTSSPLANWPPRPY